MSSCIDSGRSRVLRLERCANWIVLGRRRGRCRTGRRYNKEEERGLATLFKFRGGIRALLLVDQEYRSTVEFLIVVVEANIHVLLVEGFDTIYKCFDLLNVTGAPTFSQDPKILPCIQNFRERICIELA